MTSNEFLQMYARILASYYNAAAKTCQEYGLNHTCFDILVFLDNNPQYDTARQIESVRGIKKAMEAIAIDKLAQSGYLLRREDESDRRVKHLKLTEKSRRITGIGRELQDAFQKHLVADLTAEELSYYEKISRKMLLALNDMEGNCLL